MFKFLLSIWVVSILIPLAPTIMSDLLDVGRLACHAIKSQSLNKYCFRGRHVCIIVWPDGAQGGSAYDLGYNLVFFAISYIFPMILMTYSYVRIYIALNKKLNVAVQSSALLKSIEMKQKVGGCLIFHLIQ